MINTEKDNNIKIGFVNDNQSKVSTEPKQSKEKGGFVIMMKRNWTKIAKAIIFFAIAIVFSSLTFYDIDLNIIHPLNNEPLLITSSSFLMAFWNDVFEATKSWLLVGLFSLLGIFELMEIKK